MDDCRGGPTPTTCSAARHSTTHATASEDCCAAKEGELAALVAQADVRRVLLVVLAINLAMFVAEFAAGVVARSTALIADSVDMLGDSFVYLLSLYALNRGDRWRAGAALTKGIIIAAFGAGVAAEAITKIMSGVTPTSGTMLLFGSFALVANLACLVLLYRHRKRDVNMSSTFECSRNDVIANVGVLIAAAGVRVFDSGWPDIVVGAAIALLFGRSALRVIRSAWSELRSPARPAMALDATD